MKTSTNNILKKGTEVIVTMIDGEKVEGTIVKKHKNIFNDKIFYEVKFTKTYTIKFGDDMEHFETMDFIPVEAVVKK